MTPATCQAAWAMLWFASDPVGDQPHPLLSPSRIRLQPADVPCPTTRGSLTRSLNTSRAYHRMLSALVASIDTIARITVDPATCGQDSSLTLIRPSASRASRRAARSTRLTSGQASAITIEHRKTADAIEPTPLTEPVNPLDPMVADVDAPPEIPEPTYDMAAGMSDPPAPEPADSYAQAEPFALNTNTCDDPFQDADSEPSIT